MFNTVRLKVAAIGLLLSGIVVGVAAAQVASTFRRTEGVASGLFTLAVGEAMNFHVALDDLTSGPVGRVHMRLYDHAGVVRAERLVSLAPGQSATLPWDIPGKYRVQADVLESTSSLSSRRQVATTVELYDLDDLLRKNFVCTIPPDKV
jgi:hypothetical protein